MRFDTDTAGFSQGPIVEESPIIVAELSYNSRLTVVGNQLVGADRSIPSQQLIDVLNRLSISIRPRFRLSARVREFRTNRPVQQLSEIPKRERAHFAQAGFIEIETNRKCKNRLLEALGRIPSVWKATDAPQPVPAIHEAHPADVLTGRTRGSRNFEPAQGYLHAAPWGVEVSAAWAREGGRGKDITICDVECNWLRAHEDLPRGIPAIGGRFIDNEHWRNHGTAVLGVLCAQPGITGIQGVCSDARCVVQSGYYPSGFNVSRAITSAAEKLKSGDIILIELQAQGPTNRYIPMQWWDDVYSATLSSVERGITVIAAAGNGGVDFDSAPFDNSNLQKDSGAILVGAGIPPTNIYDVDRAYELIGPPRAGMPFTNFGSEVRVQAWGWHVTTLGYGDAQGGSQHRWATLRFSGTSSAAAIMAGVVACLQGISKNRFRQVIQPKKLRELIISTGSSQSGEKHIGPQPNLRLAVERLLANGPD